VPSFSRNFSFVFASSDLIFCPERHSQSAPGFSAFSSDENVWKLIETLQEIARETSRSVPQVSLKWLLQKSRVDTVVIGARTLAQLEDNCGAGLDWELTKEQMARLDDCSAPNVPCMS
jgi:aryl-alcohol dehydrogenase-like predicted oxidoreductase